MNGNVVRNLKNLSAAALMGIFLVGCANEKHSDLEQFIADTKKIKGGPLSPVREPEPYEAFEYAATNLRSPFRPATANVLPPSQITTLCDDKVKPNLNRRKQELERFALESLTMVGTWEQGGQNWALIQGADRQLHRAMVGDHIGLNYGVIVSVSETEIKIREIIPDGQGCFEYRPTKLSMLEE